MVEDPLRELRHIRHQIEQACVERGQTYADYSHRRKENIHIVWCIVGQNHGSR